jgi:predicted Zn-dependent peptidase
MLVTYRGRQLNQKLSPKKSLAKLLAMIKTKIAISILITLWVWSTIPLAVEAKSIDSTPNNSIQPYINKVIDRVSEFSLDNGMKFIVLENHEAPVVSFVTYANVGGVDEPDGKTGVAHFLEHLAFKGTKEIGTTDYNAEAKLLAESDRLFDEIQAANTAGDIETVELLSEKFQKVQQEANKYVKQNEYGEIVDTAGGVGLNAVTSADYTSYFYSFPANKLELWMSLESERFLEPVFREFYKEKQVILEERRLRTDNSPIGKTIEAFLDKAFVEHPYKRPVIGYDRDIANLTSDDVRKFFATYYVPNNLTVAIAGDVDSQEVKRLATVYFGRYQAKPVPIKIAKIEPPQQETREVTVNFPSQPWYLEGYHIPSLNNLEYPIYEVIADLLSSGRTSRLYHSLIEQQQVALGVEGFNGFPGDKYPNLMLFYGLTAPGHSVDQLADALRGEIDRLKTEKITPEELERVKTQLKAELLRTLDSNMGMARLLAEYDAKTGSWRKLFNQLKSIEAVTAADVMRIAQKTFVPENRTIGKLLPT